eukprot:CAMPEP_0202903080 /NCGR_PEP_ID=MMETSP1392-20130828/21038_1 /ASSEMBLY_ACC=CAM_ASM_000868 /TAXON_ID=225041 /ORGANISM="Chlamydomonas chlamydogama, Strain SAG 11-48b" /LENGTH=61 /DNA_ID=CAMNT_0049590047 /DNA_START=118 /DNA_END=303 /DNA_ORIENTATION=-
MWINGRAATRLFQTTLIWSFTSDPNQQFMIQEQTHKHVGASNNITVPYTGQDFSYSENMEM